MKITRIRVFQTGLPYVGGAYVWGAGNAIETAIASVVVIDTDAGLQGCGYRIMPGGIGMERPLLLSENR